MEAAPKPSFIARERASRLAKQERLGRRSPPAYGYDRDHSVAEVRAEFEGLAPGEERDEPVRVAGRLMLIRRHGGLVFADLKDQTGTVQLFMARDALAPDAFADIKDLDRGDWIGVAGTPMRTDKGELSLRVGDWTLLTKSLRALPDKHKGLTDVDTRLRQRYLDLIANPDSRRIFDIRSTVIATVRRVLTERGFTEVETPVLDASAGGAAAKPFVTHHNALDIDMYMRIALELPLKRLVVGGFERVFEIGRVFRNEGLDTRHNPEFTLLEAYEALADYHDMMDLVEAICSESAAAVPDSATDLSPPWRRVTMADLIEEVNGVRMHPSMPIEEARAICDRTGVPYESGWGAGRLMSEVYDETCEATLQAPTFVYDYPREVSPLARAHREDPDMVERFEAVVGGRELANAYSELNDAVDQKARFEAEAAAKAAGDEEAEDVDEDYVRALEYGLPPTGGLGIGLDRLVMLISGAQAIREVILFPTMRPEAGTAARTTRKGLSSSRVPTADDMRSPEPEAAPLVQASAEAQVDDLRPRRPLAWLTGVGGFLTLLPLAPGIHDRLGLFGTIVGQDTRIAGNVASALLGLALILTAPALARGKRRAWQAAIVLWALAAVVHALKGPHPIVIGYAVVLLALLIAYRDSFRARGDPGSLLQVARFVPVYLVLVLVFSAVTLLLEQERVEETVSAGGIVAMTFANLVGASGPYELTGRFADFYPAAMLGLGFLGLLVVAALLFRAVRPRHTVDAEDRDHARRLVRLYGGDTLDYFALRSDKSYFFSSDGEAMVAYTYVSGYALVAADPIGAPGSVERVLREFVAFCRERAWHLAFLAVRERDMPLYSSYGFREVYLGDEAIIRCDTFTLSGGPMKAVRSAVKRIGKDHSFRLMRESDASRTLCEDLNRIRERWRGKAPERGFTMELGGGVRGDQPDFLLAVAFDGDDKPVGFLRLVPSYGEDPGWSLDLMQRDPDAPNGVTEFLIANSALALGERGFRRLSMNFAAWGRLFDAGSPLTFSQRMLKRVAELLNPFFQIKSLRDFNEKFGPEWVPRAIVVEDPGSMPKVGLLYASVEGFVNLPVVGRFLVPRVSEDAG